ncbi:MAG: DUF6531 domain-containing protein, partial [Gaiella sp.]
HYDAEELGLGIDNLVNYANGNSLVRWTPFESPGRGLNTVVDFTYNSLENGSTSPLGNNWSLSMSGLVPFGSRLDVHPNAADTAAGRTAKWVAFTDGDGSYHRFEGFAVTGGTAYDAPPGVFLYLREDAAAPATERWSLSKPDRVTFYFDASGYPTGVKDRNGNRLEFVLSTVPAGDDAFGTAKRITRVTDAAGIGVSQGTKPDRSFDIAYYVKTDTAAPLVRGKVKSISDHLGHRQLFSYYDDGNLLRVTEEGGTNADGAFLADRSVLFTYVKTDGTPAIPGATSARLNPDPATVQTPRLYSVIDPRQNESTFTYVTTAGAAKWRVASRVNRVGKTTSYSYNTGTSVTTVDRPLSRTDEFTFDTLGRVTQIKDPLNFGAGAVTSITTVEWYPTTSLVGNLVKKVTQPTGEFEEWTYNQNGYMLSHKDELANETTVTFENVAVDANDVTGKWETGRTIPHWSQIETKTDPQGNATTTPTTDYVWTFDHDTNGNLLTVTDPLNKVQTTVWNANGTVQKDTDALNRDTVYGTNYDENGLPTQVTDPTGAVTKASHDARGNLVWLQDPNHAADAGSAIRDYRMVYDYDAFGRVGRSSEPRSTLYRRGEYTWSLTRYDANDNTTISTNPHYGRSSAGAVAPVALTTTTYDAMDRETQVAGPRSTAAGLVTSTTVYDDAGRVVKTVSPRGIETTAVTDDFATTISYDKLDRVFQEKRLHTTANETRVTSYCYDLAGDLRWVVAPKAGSGASPVFTACPTVTSPATFTAVTAPAYTTRFEYDDAHRQTKVTETAAPALGGTAVDRVTTTAYDANGAVVDVTNADGHVTHSEYNERGEKKLMEEPFDTGRVLTTKYEYDDEGNLKKLVSPRAYDFAGGGAGPFTEYVEEYTYDGLDRLTRTKLPTLSSAGRSALYKATVLDDAPAVYWRLGEASGSTAADASGNSRTGTYTGGTLNQTGAFGTDTSYIAGKVAQTGGTNLNPRK